MSHRTSRVFDVSYGYSSYMKSVKTGEQRNVQLFDALDHARFDHVRRNVAVNANCLFAKKSINTDSSPQNVLDYALHNCHTWNGLLEHCRRTGIALPHAEDFTFPRRLASMKLIIVWLLLQPNIPLPTQTPLHITILCNFDKALELLLRRAPYLVSSVDGGGKTPIHVVCSLAVYAPCENAIRFVRLLHKAGANFNAKDADGKTPLHNLVSALNDPVPAYGLVRRRRYSQTLSAVVPLVDALLASGASVYEKDSKGCSVIDFALVSGLDYIVFVKRANALRDRICGSPSAKKWKDEQVHIPRLWSFLPEEVMYKIFTHLSPKEVITGIGATCTGLRYIAVSKGLWRHLETSRCLATVRGQLQRRVDQTQTQALPL